MQEGKGKKSKKNIEDAKQEYFAIGSADKQDACGYTKTPLPLILGYLDLGDECKLTYMDLLSYAFGKDVCWPSAHTIAEDLGYHVATIYSLPGGHALTSRLATLGFTPGTELTMVQNYGWGPLIVQIRDTRIALGRGEARKIHVTADPLPTPQTSEYR